MQVLTLQRLARTATQAAYSRALKRRKVVLDAIREPAYKDVCHLLHSQRTRRSCTGRNPPRRCCPALWEHNFIFDKARTRIPHSVVPKLLSRPFPSPRLCFPCQNNSIWLRSPTPLNYELCHTRRTSTKFQTFYHKS
jgi:hypothetical protein